MNSARLLVLLVSLLEFGGYLISLPWSGPMLAIDNETSTRIPFPLETNSSCNIQSTGNMSLNLAYASTGITFCLSAFLLVYILAPRGEGITWPIGVLWVASFLSFISQLAIFVIICTRITVWFLSCDSVTKLDGSCPTARMKYLRAPITNREQCYFSAVDLAVFNSENDIFSSCQDSSQIANYNKKFARWDLPVYYTAGALCDRNEAESIGRNLAWCYYWGCDAVCMPETHNLNWRWFTLDICVLLTIMGSYLIVMGDFYIEKGIKRN